MKGVWHFGNCTCRSPFSVSAPNDLPTALCLLWFLFQWVPGSSAHIKHSLFPPECLTSVMRNEMWWKCEEVPAEKDGLLHGCSLPLLWSEGSGDQVRPERSTPLGSQCGWWTAAGSFVTRSVHGGWCRPGLTRSGDTPTPGGSAAGCCCRGMALRLHAGGAHTCDLPYESAGRRKMWS